MSVDAQDVVLVVEDEPVILMILTDYLSGQGYRVLQAENGEQAFEILASKPHLDMLITDFRLPTGNGAAARKPSTCESPSPNSEIPPACSICLRCSLGCVAKNGMV